MSGSYAELAVLPVRAGRISGMKSKTGRREEELRNNQEKRSESSTRRRELVREEEPQRRSRPCSTVAKPSKRAKLSGTPNSLIVTWPAVGRRALPASRSAHERREWVRCARDRITSALRGEPAGGGVLTSMRWCRTSRITGTPMVSPAPIAPEQGSRPHLERMQQHTHLAWLCRCSAIPLTLFAQRAGTTAANASTIDHA